MSGGDAARASTRPALAAEKRVEAVHRSLRDLSARFAELSVGGGNDRALDAFSDPLADLRQQVFAALYDAGADAALDLVTRFRELLPQEARPPTVERELGEREREHARQERRQDDVCDLAKRDRSFRIAAVSNVVALECASDRARGA